MNAAWMADLQASHNIAILTDDDGLMVIRDDRGKYLRRGRFVDDGCFRKLLRPAGGSRNRSRHEHNANGQGPSRSTFRPAILPREPHQSDALSNTAKQE